jgi:hypothetical protein
MKLRTIDTPRVAKEFIRVSAKENLDSNNGKVASRILKSLICEDKVVFLKYIDEGPAGATINTKVKKILTIMGRMLNEPLLNICGSADKIPAKYAELYKQGSRLTVVALPPVLKDTTMSRFVVENDEHVKVATEDEQSTIKKATVIQLELMIRDED